MNERLDDVTTNRLLFILVHEQRKEFKKIKQTSNFN